MKQDDRQFITIPQLAALMGYSRIAVYKQVKKGHIRAMRVGRIHLISKNEVERLLGTHVGKDRIAAIDKAVDRTIKEYGEVLRLLGDA